MINRTLARPYAKAVFLNAKQNNSYDNWKRQLQLLSEVCKSTSVKKLVYNQTILSVEKQKFFEEIGAGHIDNQAKNLLKVLSYYKRLALLPEIYTLYEEYRMDEQSEYNVNLIINQNFDIADIGGFAEKISQKLKGKVNVISQKSNEIICGAKAALGDRILDSSMQGKLRALYSHMLGR